MSVDWFFEKFDLIAEAPGAVARMRTVILTLAVQGKLVPQFAEDESGERLVDKLKAVILNKNGRRTSLLEPITADEIPFDLPAGWVWERLGNLGETNIGLTYSPQDVSDEGIPVLRSNNIQNGKLDLDDLVRVTCVLKQSAMVQDGDLLICARNGSRALVGKVAPIEHLKEPAAFGAFMAIFRSRINPYLFHFICSPLFRRMIDEVNTTTINQITQYNLRSTLAPIPPLAEQKRIVAKVDELMALCDQLEAEQKERETRKSVLVRASLARFAEAPTPTNLGNLFHESYDIPPAELRKSILTLAVQGKLVPQDANDEPAISLLQRIATLKASLESNGKLRGSTLVTPLPIDEMAADIPSSWCWARFGEVMINRDGERIPVSKEERETKKKIYDYYGASGIIDKIDDYLFDKPLLLIGEDGANLVNRSTPIAFIARGKYWVNNHAHVLDGFSEDFLRYIEIYINAINLEPYVTGSAQPKMNQAKMNSIPIALPPLAEQRRIVAKVEQLMALVDELERQQELSRTAASKLIDAVVHELTHPN
jgi:type I restriction enzyme S subunit